MLTISSRIPCPTTGNEGYDPDSDLFDEQAMISRKVASKMTVRNNDFYYLWNEVLRLWFLGTDGWKVRQQKVTKFTIPTFEVNVRCNSGGRWVQNVVRPHEMYFDEKHVILAVVKSALRWSDEGQKNVLMELQTIMQDRLSKTGVPVVWGIAAIGWQWMAVKEERSGAVQELISWKSDVLSLESWRAMKEMADSIKESV
ncbi:hypothetical protein FS837_004991 [Tulasnella sp. UAMH 9824]|nr:hypothetical protein FS837_004991 [Tulasnella sp. UAMH 9824]